MPGLYLFTLIFSLFGLGILDRKYRLVWWHNARAAKVIFVSMLALFVMWDIAGIVLDIFFVGDTKLLLGLTYKDLPIEELFFLSLLIYTSLIAYTFVRRKSAK